MQVSVIIGVATGLTIFVALCLVLLLLKYRSYRKSTDAKEKLYGSIYVKLFNQEERKQRSRRTGVSALATESVDSNRLCSGLVKVVPQHEQVEMQEAPGRSVGGADTDSDAISTRSCASQSSAEPDSKERTFPLRKMSSMLSIPTLNKSASVSDERSESSTLTRSKIHWKSMSNLIGASKRFNSPKRKRMKQHRSSHSLNIPKTFTSAQAALSAVELLDEGEDDDNVFTTPVEPDIILSMMYNDSKSSLTVTVLSIHNLDKKLSEHNMYVQAYLRPRHHEKQTTQAVPGLNPEFHECFYFDKVRVSDLLTSHLMLTLHKTVSNKKIGELFINMAMLSMNYGETCHFRFPLITKPRSRRKSTLEKLLQFELGQLMVLLHFQPIPNRIKVMVNKAIQLPKTESIPFKPDYQVNVELYGSADHTMIESKSTSVQSGENPVWNEAFLFCLESDQLNDYYLEFTVLEKRRYKPSDAVIGHVVLGAEGTSQQAISQWNDCLLPFKLEVARWHTILPVIKYNINEDS